ncbi:MAG: hypothetical protein GY778_23480 [bacterium]|nr:hypothetical protein [bacterium]
MLFVAGLVCFVPGVVVLVVHLIRVFRAGGMAWPLPKWLFLAQLWVVPFALWVAGRRVRAQRIRPVMLAHRRCPHCGYALRGLPTAPEDGATVCPECGCAWLLGEAAKGE